MCLIGGITRGIISLQQNGLKGVPGEKVGEVSTASSLGFFWATVKRSMLFQVAWEPCQGFEEGRDLFWILETSHLRNLRNKASRRKEIIKVRAEI